MPMSSAMPPSKSFYVDSLLTKTSSSTRDKPSRTRTTTVPGWFSPLLPSAPMLLHQGPHQSIFCRKGVSSTISPMPPWFPCCPICVRGTTTTTSSPPAVVVSNSVLSRDAGGFSTGSAFHHHSLEHLATSSGNSNAVACGAVSSAGTAGAVGKVKNEKGIYEVLSLSSRYF